MEIYKSVPKKYIIGINSREDNKVTGRIQGLKGIRINSFGGYNIERTDNRVLWPGQDPTPERIERGFFCQSCIGLCANLNCWQKNKAEDKRLGRLYQKFSKLTNTLLEQMKMMYSQMYHIMVTLNEISRKQVTIKGTAVKYNNK